MLQGHYGHQKSKIYNGIIVFDGEGCKEIIVKDYTSNQYTENMNYVFGRKTVTTYVLGYLPFNNIIGYDLEGDEFYQFPHIFCDYVSGNNSFEFLRYAVDTERGFYIFENDDVLEAKLLLDNLMGGRKYGC